MKARQLILIIFTTLLLLPGKWLLAQEYLDLWRGGKTDNFYLIQQKFNEYFANRDKGRGSGYKQFKRWEHFMSPRVYPSGKLINPVKLALDEELRYASRSRSTQHRAPVPGDNWTSLGITGYTRSTGLTPGMGRVNCIAPHPTDPQTLFVGTPTGGLWKTTDGGQTWTPLSDGLPLIGVSGIAIKPSNPDSIYILTGDGDGTNTYSTGVLLTKNGGQTWQSTGLQWNANQEIYGFKLLMHPTDPKTLYVATTNGIYKTMNGGRTWSNIKAGPIMDIAFKPGAPSTVYATQHNSYFYISTNGGNSWTQSMGLGKVTGRAAIGVTPNNTNLILIIAGTYGQYRGVYKSTDGGQNWTIATQSPNLLGFWVKPPENTFESTQAEYDIAIAVSPANKNEVHVGGINCWRSMDGGTGWAYTSFFEWDDSKPGEYTHADIHTLVFIDDRLYCGSDGGVFYSDDHADPNTMSWHDISKGLEITQFYSIAAPANDLNTLWGGTQDNGFNKWTAPATTMDSKTEGDIVQSLVDYSNANNVYGLSAQGGALFVTKNGGTSFDPFKPDPSLRWTADFSAPLVMHPTDPTQLYAGYNMVVKIAPGYFGGMDFTAISPAFDANLVALGVSVNAPSSMYAATPKKLWRCTDILATPPNTTWTDITAGLPVTDAQITSIQVSPTNVNEVWVCFSGYSAGEKIYYTSNGGSNWENISGTLPNVPVNCIAYHDNGQDGIYIGTDIGVFYKDNTMNDWEPFRNGLPNVLIYDLEITQNKIRAATFGRGIWQSDLRGNVCVENYTLSGDITGYQSLWANTISSTANIIGGIGTEVYYKAGTTITMGTGFKVAPESRFLASIGDCNSTGMAARQYDGVYDGVMAGAVGIASGVDSVKVQTDRLKVYPNPFSGQSTIEFYIAKTTAVNISLWDLSGKKIKVLFESASRAPGNYQVRLDAAGLRSGTYVVRLHAQDYEETKKIVIAQ